MLHSGQAGPANIISTPERRLRTNLTKAVEGCPAPEYIAGCFAGLLTEDDRERAHRFLTELFPAAKIRLEPDSYAALKASRPGTHICVIAGTGSVVCSEVAGRYTKSGGRGYLLGDAGSAYRYGQDALIHYLQAPDDASEPMKKAIESRFGSLEENPIIARLYRAGSPQAQLAKLATALASDARNGYPYAVESIARWSGTLAGIVRDHADRYLSGIADLRVSLAGGLWEASAVYRNAFQQALCGALSDRNVEVSPVEQPPVRGAVLLAQEMESN